MFLARCAFTLSLAAIHWQAARSAEEVMAERERLLQMLEGEAAAMWYTRCTLMW